MMRLAVLLTTSAALVGAIAPLVAQSRDDPGGPATFSAAPGEVWTESGLRTVDNALRLEPAADRVRIRLVTRNREEITIEGATLTVLGGGNRVGVKSLGRAIVASRSGRRMEADSVEVWLSGDGWIYMKAVRHPG
jgi:hypothetical protein